MPGTDRLCVIRLAGRTLGVRLESVAEIVPMADLSRPPSMPSILEGFLNLGGTAIPVLRLARLLGLPQERFTLQTLLVILRGTTSPLALLVETVTDIVAVPEGSLMPFSDAASFNGCVGGQVMAGGNLVYLLSIDRLLLEQEQRKVAEFQATEQARLRQIDPVSS